MLDGLKAIAWHLGGPDFSTKRVRALARKGAPIRVVGDGLGRRYLADSDALDAWLRVENGQKPAGSA